MTITYKRWLLLLLFTSTVVTIVSLTDIADVLSLENVLDLKIEESNSIFFLDTTVVSDNYTRVEISPRTACSVESAARIHSERPVYLLYTTPGFVNLRNNSENYFLELLRLGNVKICYADMTQLAKDTPVEELVRSKFIESSKFKIHHYSDLLRLLVLWRFGGIYLDNDVLVLKSFDGLATNFVGLEDELLLANCVLAFRGDLFRKRTVGKLLTYFNKTYDRDSWGGNGPVLLSGFVSQMYGTGNFTKTLNKLQGGLKIYPRKYFCPLYWPEWRLYFKASASGTLEKSIADSYALHLWNEQSKDEKVQVTWDGVPYVKYAKKHCPSVTNNVPVWF